MLYRAPEILLHSPDYATPVDIWAVGCIFFEMVTKFPLFQGDSENDMIYRMMRLLGTPTNREWPGVEGFENYANLLVPEHERVDLREQYDELWLGD